MGLDFYRFMPFITPVDSKSFTETRECVEQPFLHPTLTAELQLKYGKKDFL